MPTYDGLGGVVGDGAVPPGFQPDHVLRCRMNAVGGDETFTRFTIVEERAQPRTTELLTVLALPDQDFTDPRMACDLLPDPWVVTVLVDQGGDAVVPRLPREPCGSPRSEVDAMLDALDWVTVDSNTFNVPR